MNSRDDIRSFLTTLAAKEARFGDSDSLLTSKMLDSLKVAELVVFLESHFKISLEAEEVSPENLDSIDAMVKLVERKGAGGS